MKKEAIESKEFIENQYIKSLQLLRIIILLAILGTVLSSIADYINLKGVSGNHLILAAKVALILLLGLCHNRIKAGVNVNKLKNNIIIIEIVGTMIFLVVFLMYETPNLLIQSLSLLLIVTTIYMTPNRWLMKISIVLVTTIIFILHGYQMRDYFGIYEFIVSILYLLAIVAVQSMFSYSYQRYQYREFIAIEQMSKLYETDQLTKVGNRYLFEKESKKIIENYRNHKIEFCIVAVDIDSMKYINDNYGHLVGDSIIYEVAQVMKNSIGNKNTCIRWGGDEFLLLLSDTNIQQAEKICDSIKIDLEKVGLDKDISVKCSIGIAQFSENETLDELLKKADENMYSEKNRKEKLEN